MAKYYGSPWGTLRGKLNGAVGGGWKGINWARVLIYPTQHGTIAMYKDYKNGIIPPEDFSFPQFNLRRLSTGPLGNLAKNNMSNLINPIWAQYTRRKEFLMSGLNAYIKYSSADLLNSMPDKTAEFDPDTNSPDLRVIQMSRGELEETIEFSECLYAPLTGAIYPTWDMNIYKNGKSVDLAYIAILSKPIVESYGVDGTWEPALYLYGPAQKCTRADGDGGAIGGILPTGLDPEDLTAFTFFRDVDNIIGYSKSASVQVTEFIP